MTSCAWIPLSELAHGRSGDKGDCLNIGLVAHRREWLELLSAAVTPDLLREWFGDMLRGEVRVWELPGIGAINCLLEGALGGGGTTSLMLDAQGKAWGQSVLRLRVPVDISRARALGLSLNAASVDRFGEVPLD